MRPLILLLLSGCAPHVGVDAFADAKFIFLDDGRQCVWTQLASAARINPTDTLYLCCAEAGGSPECEEAAWVRTDKGIEIAR